MTRSPPKAKSGKGEESGEAKRFEDASLAKFDNLAKRLFGTSKEDLNRELEKEKRRKTKEP